MFAQLAEITEFFKSQFGLSSIMTVGPANPPLEGMTIGVIVVIEDADKDLVQVVIKSTLESFDVDVKEWAENIAAQMDVEIEKALGGHNEH